MAVVQSLRASPIASETVNSGTPGPGQELDRGNHVDPNRDIIVGAHNTDRLVMWCCHSSGSLFTPAPARSNPEVIVRPGVVDFGSLNASRRSAFGDPSDTDT